MRILGNTLVQCAIAMAASVAVLLAIRPPIPASVLIFYLAVVAVGLGVYVTSTSASMQSFWSPIHALLTRGSLRIPRIGVLVLIPLLAAGLSAWMWLPSNTAPIALRVIHPAPPASIRFDGKTINLRAAENPLRESKVSDPDAFREHVARGMGVYYQRCMQCHGDHLDGDGPFAVALNPRPANFMDVGTIAQLQESYLFWRIAKGGPGLPGESAPGRSAMPNWEGRLSEEEIWSVILFLYEKTGRPPRTWE